MRVLGVLALALFAVAAFGQTVEVKGNKHVSREAIIAALPIKPADAFTEDAKRLAQEAIGRMGFFKGVQVDKNEKGILIQVEEWPIVEAVVFDGNQALSDQDLNKVLPVELGKIFNANSFASHVAKVRDLYTRKGFFGDIIDIKFDEAKPTTLRVILIEMTVNSVTPYGNKRTKSEIIERLMFTKPGMPFRRDRWEADIRRLWATNWFTDVKAFSREAEPGKIDLVPAVLEGKTGEWTAGLSAEPGSPVVGTFGIAERNWKGTGQSISLKGAQGLQTQGPSLSTDYSNPFFGRGNIGLQVSLYTRSQSKFAGIGLEDGEDPGDRAFSERRTGGSVGLVKNLDAQTSAHVGVRIEAVEANDPKVADKPSLTRQSGALAALVFGFVRNRRDTDVDPSRGDFLRLGLEPGFSRITKVGGSLTGAAGIGDHTYVKSTAEYRTYWSLDPRRSVEEFDRPSRVFALRVRYGSIYGDAPFSEQFFAGGTDSVRGYAQDRYWGNQMFLSSLEYRHPINRDLGIIGFVDYGGAWGGYGGLNNFTQSRSINLQLGYGLGLSYRMPRVGPLRLDFGFDRAGRMKTHFQIATPF